MLSAIKAHPLTEYQRLKEGAVEHAQPAAANGPRPWMAWLWHAKPKNAQLMQVEISGGDMPRAPAPAEDRVAE